MGGPASAIVEGVGVGSTETRSSFFIKRASPLSRYPDDGTAGT